MAVRVKFDKEPEYTDPKLDDLGIETVPYKDYSGIPANGSGIAPAEKEDSSPQEKKNKGYNWFSWSLKIGLGNQKKVVDNLSHFLKELDRIQQALLLIVKIMRVFVTDLKSISKAIKFVVKQIVKVIKDMVESLSSTGVYMSVIFPPFDSRDTKYSIPINGGFNEFIAIVNQRCSNSNDPDAPRFGSNDTVGGIIISMVGGDNDPQFLDDMIKNFKVLSKLFPMLAPVAAPPKNVKAVPGFYKGKDGKKSLGVKITWDHPGTPLSGFNIYRNRSPKPFKVLDSIDLSSVGEEERIIEVFNDASFNDGTPVEIKTITGKPSYTYIDFEVTGGKTYYYKVYSTTGYDFGGWGFLDRVQSPSSSPVVSATPTNCIPVSELKKYSVLDKKGNTVKPEEFNGDWQSFSVRTLLGTQIDRLYDLLDLMSEKVQGLVDTSTDSMSKYIEFLEEKILLYTTILNQLEIIIKQLLAYQLRGTMMVLELEPQKGGMQGFLDRFNAATQSGDVSEYSGKGAPDTPKGLATYAEKGIMAGIILLYGFPELSSDYILEMVDVEGAAKLQANMKKTMTAVDSFKKLVGI